MDFGASTSGFEARLCHLIFYLFGIECCYSTKILATATHPTCFALGSNIPSVRRREQRFHFLQCRRSSLSFRFVNRSGGTLRRAGWVAFTKTYSRGKWLILHLPPTFAIIIHIPRPLLPCIWRPHVPVSHVPASPRPLLDVLKSLVLRPQVPSPHTRVPMSPSPCPRPTFIHSLTHMTYTTFIFVKVFWIRTNTVNVRAKTALI